MTRYRDRYEDIYQQLTRAELQRGSDGLAELVAGPELFERGTDRWLGFYTLDGLDIALEKYGFYRDLAALGFDDVRIEVRTDDPDKHLLRLWSKRPEVTEPLVELVVRRDFLRPASELSKRVKNSHLPVLTIDWLLLQNPCARFQPERPPLPGQRYPGLGVGAQVLEMLRNVCRRLDLAGLANVPSYFHNSLFYSEEFRHFDPRWQGAFLALCRDLKPGGRFSIAAASWATHWKLLRDRNAEDSEFSWFQQLMLYPLSESLIGYFDDSRYRREVQKGLRSHKFGVDEDRLKNKLEETGIEPFDPDKLSAWLE